MKIPSIKFNKLSCTDVQLINTYNLISQIDLNCDAILGVAVQVTNGKEAQVQISVLY